MGLVPRQTMTPGPRATCKSKSNDGNKIGRHPVEEAVVTIGVVQRLTVASRCSRRAVPPEFRP